MINFPNILVCTDFSIFSDYAMKAAEKIRKKSDSKVFALNIHEYSINWDWMPPNYSEGGYQVEMLKIIKNKIKDQLSKNQVEGTPSVSFGVISQAIINFIEENKIDLVIMGHIGRTGHLSLGSTAVKILATSPVPVLIVKKDFEMKNVSLLVDPYGATKKLFKFGKDIIDSYFIELHILSLIPDIAARYIGIGKLGFSTELLSLTDDQKKKLTTEVIKSLKNQIDFSDRCHFHVETTVEKRIAYQLNRTLLELHSELIIMQRHQSTFMEKVLIGSETRRMIEIFEGNLFILPP
jgi:nucleotide-binding universal stress UspA family protein